MRVIVIQCTVLSSPHWPEVLSTAIAASSQPKEIPPVSILFLGVSQAGCKSRDV